LHLKIEGGCVSIIRAIDTFRLIEFLAINPVA